MNAEMGSITKSVAVYFRSKSSGQKQLQMASLPSMSQLNSIACQCREEAKTRQQENGIGFAFLRENRQLPCDVFGRELPIALAVLHPPFLPSLALAS